MKTALLALPFVALFAAPAIAATTIAANTSTPTLIGTFGPGTYQVTTTGVISLAGTAGDGQFDVDANGVPVTPVQFPQYSYFNPNGSTTADGQSGIAPGLNIGSLVGSFSSTPSATDFFSLGRSTTLKFTQTTSLYGVVNDLSFAYGNNSGAFSLNIAAVPEPATWGMMIAGFGIVGAAVRRRAPKVSFA